MSKTLSQEMGLGGMVWRLSRKREQNVEGRRGGPSCHGDELEPWQGPDTPPKGQRVRERRGMGGRRETSRLGLALLVPPTLYGGMLWPRPQCTITHRSESHGDSEEEAGRSLGHVTCHTAANHRH